MAAKWTRCHRDGDPLPELPIALPLLVVVKRVVRKITGRRAHLFTLAHVHLQGLLNFEQESRCTAPISSVWRFRPNLENVLLQSTCQKQGFIFIRDTMELLPCGWR